MTNIVNAKQKKSNRNIFNIIIIALILISLASLAFASNSSNTVLDNQQASVSGNAKKNSDSISFDTSTSSTSTTSTTTTPTTPPTSTVGPYTNSKGTYFSTLGATDSIVKFANSQNIYWNKKLPDNTPRTPNYKEQARIFNNVAKALPIGSNVNNGNPIYNYKSDFIAGGNSPAVLLVDSDREDFQKVDLDCTGAGGSLKPLWNWTVPQFESFTNDIYGKGKGVPIPKDYVLYKDNGGDFPLSIYDYKKDIYISFWRYRNSSERGKANPGACWSGYSLNFSKDSNTQTTIDQLNARNFQAWGMIDNPNYWGIQPSLKSTPYPMGISLFPTGTGAAGINDIGTMPLLEEIRRGEINHTIGVSLPYLKQGQSWPANRNDANGNNNWCYRIDASQNNCLQEGQRLRFPANYDISKISNPYARMFVKAIRDYGMVVDDYSGCTCIQVENDLQLTGRGLPAFMSPRLNETAAFYAIPWQDLEVLPENWGRP